MSYSMLSVYKFAHTGNSDVNSQTVVKTKAHGTTDSLLMNDHVI